jgi:hypothetical protein
MAPSFAADAVRIHPDCQTQYDRLEKDARDGRKPGASIWKSLQAAFQRAKRSAQFADPIPVRSIPRHFRERYDVSNLYCVDLADFHRGLYTLVGRVVVFLDVVDHAQYDKWFPNKGK